MTDTFHDIMTTHLLTYWIGSMAFMLADFSGIFVEYKLKDRILGDRPLPSFPEHCLMVLVSIANQIMAIPLIYLAAPYVTQEVPHSLMVPMFQLIFYILVGDMWFYVVHRLMHTNRKLYEDVHRYHHMYRYPVAVSTLFADPAEHLLCNIMSIMIGPLISPAKSTFLLLLWVFLVTANGLIAHCGYKLPITDAVKHDIHHRLMTHNFGTLGLSDRLFGTYRAV
jgi:sterol desaturase/sphingolipid hydroxylase (fatty acid hydroxylase superfamily)